MFNEKPVIAKWVADMYDQNETETEDVDFLLSVIGHEPKNILEIACGSGRILVPLSKAGHTVSGLEADEYMLVKIPAKAEGLENIQWRKADAVYDDWGKGFDVVVLAANILYNIISDMDYTKSQELFIQKAAAAMVPSGHVYIDYNPAGRGVNQSPPSENNPDSKGLIWEGTDADGNFGRMVLVGDSYDASTRMDSFQRRFEMSLKNGETVVQEFPCHKHFAPLSQLHEWLQKAGFVIEQEYGGGYKKNPVNDDSKRVIIYAKKEYN